MSRIDTHHHIIPADYRKALRNAGIDEAGGRALPDWSSDTALQTMAELDVATAIVSVSTPGTTFLPKSGDAAALARDLTTTPPTWSRLSLIGSGSSPPSRCRMSTPPSPKSAVSLTNSKPTA